MNALEKYVFVTSQVQQEDFENYGYYEPPYMTQCHAMCDMKNAHQYTWKSTNNEIFSKLNIQPIIKRRY